MVIMNDYDTEEQLLLNALNDNTTQYNQQRYNLDFDDSLIDTNNRQSSDRGNSNNNSFDLPEPTESYEPYDLEPNQISGHVSIGSLSPEEFLENLNELNEDDRNNNIPSTDVMAPDANTHQKPSTKLSRRITFCENEDNSKEQNLLDSKPPTHQRSKSTVSVDSSSNDPEAPVRVKEPTDADILCGQSRVCANHPGNRFFQQVLEEFAYRYELATSKQEKMCMTKEIVSRIHNSRGRFLKQKKDGMWEEISTVAARDKVSHALRTKVAGWKRNREQEQRNRGSVTPPHSRRSSMSRSSIRAHRRRSSNPEQSSSSSDLVPIPFDGDDANSEQVLSGLMKSQKEIYATMNSLLTGNHHNGNYNGSYHQYHPQQQPSSHRHSFPTYQGNSHYRMER